jgi:hypothetical protein
MRKIILLLPVLLSLQYSSIAQADTVKLNTLLKKVDTVLKQADTLKPKVETIKIKVDTLYNRSMLKKDCGCVAKTDIGFGWVLVFLPALVFLLIFFVIYAKGLNRFDIGQALAESEYVKLTVINEQYNSDNIAKILAANPQADIQAMFPPTLEVSSDPKVAEDKSSLPKPLPSISRYIAFITSILTLIVALCMSCFFIYHYMATGCAPDLTPLSMVLIALGIGVAPYAFNKVSAAITNTKKND